MAYSQNATAAAAEDNFCGRALGRIEEGWRYAAGRRWLAQMDLFRIPRVAVIVGNSRGGTSMLATLLRQHPDTLSLDGEHSPYYKLVGAAYPWLASDEVPRDHKISTTSFSRLLMAALGTPASSFNAEDWLDRFVLRLPMQIDRELPQALIRSLLKGARTPFELQQRLPALLTRLGLNEQYYDRYPFCFPRKNVAGPRGLEILEETPYVLPDLWKRVPSPRELATKLLVLKASVDAYRLPWLCDLFKNSELYFIHLTRNPAASINGLIDGWLSPGGFYSYDVGPLNIAGYSERHPAHRRLWCFDLPPGWEQRRNAALPEVCAFQWSTAHRAILDNLPKERTVRLRFEDLTDSQTSRERALRTLGGFLGLGEGDRFYCSALRRMPVVMRTAFPRKGRWLDREKEVLTGLECADQSVVKELYPKREGWT